MTRKRRLAIGSLAGALAAAAAGAALATGEGGESPMRGPDADRAASAALAITGGGTVNAVERDGERGASWEVEVTRPDGVTVDVRLDSGFGLVVVDGDSESADADDAAEQEDGGRG